MSKGLQRDAARPAAEADPGTAEVFTLQRKITHAGFQKLVALFGSPYNKDRSALGFVLGLPTY